VNILLAIRKKGRRMEKAVEAYFTNEILLSAATLYQLNIKT
jgi:hypothetical protein